MPRIARIVAWSSAATHISGKDDRLVAVRPMLELVKKEWADFLGTPVSEDEISALRKHEGTGRPLCAPWFLDQLEALLERPLKPEKASRKPKGDKLGMVSPDLSPDLLKVLYILGGLDDNDVEWLIAGGERKRLHAGEVLISEGKNIEALYILMEGELAASIKTHKGHRELGKMSVGDMVGEVSLVDDRPASATVTVVRDAHVLAVPRTALMTKLGSDIGFAARFYHAVAQLLSYRLRDNTALIAGEGGPPVPELEKDEDLLGLDVLDNVHMAGERFSRIMRRLAG